MSKKRVAASVRTSDAKRRKGNEASRALPRDVLRLHLPHEVANLCCQCLPLAEVHGGFAEFSNTSELRRAYVAWRGKREDEFVYELTDSADAESLTNKIRESGAERILVVAGPGVTRFPNNFLFGCPKLTTADFVAPWVVAVGNYWMCKCSALTLASFQGLPALRTVGLSWMGACLALKKPSFHGLGDLERVGDGWMYVCPALENPSFQGLESLQTVGNGWMETCKNLTNPSFQGMGALRTVGDCWMAYCDALREPSFEGLEALQTVGYSWMRGCATLKSPSFQGLDNLAAIGNFWMHACPALDKQSPDTPSCPHRTSNM